MDIIGGGPLGDARPVLISRLPLRPPQPPTSSMRITDDFAARMAALAADPDPVDVTDPVSDSSESDTLFNYVVPGSYRAVL